jgi:hypothetical protein
MYYWSSRSFLFVCLCLTHLIVQPVCAQWGPDSSTNTLVCDTVGQQDYPQICSDGSNGAIVVWEDARSNTFSIYAQHLDAKGRATWTRNGVMLAQTSADQRYPIIASDGSGGAYVVWQDQRNAATKSTDLYGQHILADGSLGYSNVGIAVANAAGNQDNAVICADGSGNAFVAWEDSRNASSLSRPDIYMNRLTSSGVSFGPTGMVVDASINRQVGPSICPDGQGGCYLAWEDEGKIPSAIYARRINSSGNMLWSLPSPHPAVLIYQAGATANNPQPNSSNVSISLDSGQLLLAWEVTSSTSSSNGQNILAQRMNCSTTTDTTPVYLGGPMEITGEWLNDQVTPQIFSDDSAWGTGTSTFRGVLVPFVDLEPSSTDDYDIAMVRVLGDGATSVPPSGNGFYFLEQQAHAQSGFKAIKITDSDPNKNGILAVWNDARYYGLGEGKDTTIFAQRIDRSGHNYFQTGGKTKLAEPICSSPTPNGWIAKQVALAPRTDGGIAVWTDFRKGVTNPSIYAQLILMNGTLSIPTDTTPPAVQVVSTTPPDNNNACNSQCSDLLAYDHGSLISGIESITPVGMTNMELQTANFTKGADSVTFSVCVIDSFKNGTGSVTVEDTSLNVQTMNFTYCTIADTSAPLITIDTANSKLVYIHIRDDRAWDRGISSVVVWDTSNVILTHSKLNAGAASFDDTMNINDPLLAGSFCIKAIDAAANTSRLYCYNYSPSSDVAPSKEAPILLSVFPNPTDGDASVRLDGAPFADVTVLDVLGRSVEQFHLEGSRDIRTNSLPAGTYIIRATIGSTVISKQIVKK